MTLALEDDGSVFHHRFCILRPGSPSHERDTSVDRRHQALEPVYQKTDFSDGRCGKPQALALVILCVVHRLN
jgi:hypothetical protein